MKISFEQLIKEAISEQVSKRENREAGKAEDLPPEIMELFQIHPQLKAFAESLENYRNRVNTNPCSFPEDDEIQYSQETIHLHSTHKSSAQVKPSASQCTLTQQVV